MVFNTVLIKGFGLETFLALSIHNKTTTPGGRIPKIIGSDFGIPGRVLDLSVTKCHRLLRHKHKHLWKMKKKVLSLFFVQSLEI
jgi:hypothetical protein